MEIGLHEILSAELLLLPELAMGGSETDKCWGQYEELAMSFATMVHARSWQSMEPDENGVPSPANLPDGLQKKVLYYYEQQTSDGRRRRRPRRLLTLAPLLRCLGQLVSVLLVVRLLCLFLLLLAAWATQRLRPCQLAAGTMTCPTATARTRRPRRLRAHALPLPRRSSAQALPLTVTST